MKKKISTRTQLVQGKAQHLYRKIQAALPESAKQKIDKGEEYLRKGVNLGVEMIKTFDRQLLTYFPFIGWMYPLWEYPEEEFIMSHVRQAIVMAGFFAAVETVMYVSTFMLPSGWRAARLSTILGIYLLDIFYFTWAVKGTMMIQKKKKLEIPFFARYAERLEI